MPNSSTIEDCGHLLCRLRPGEPCAQRQPKPRGRPPKPKTERRRQIYMPEDHSTWGEHGAFEPYRLHKRVVPADAKPLPKPRLTKAQAKELAIRVEVETKARAARRSFAEFFKQGWHVLEPEMPVAWNWHLQAICDHLQAVFEGWKKKQEFIRVGKDDEFEQPVRNLLINVPPRTAKSLIMSVFFPAWAWLHWPSFKILCISGNDRVIERDSASCRQVIESAWYRDTFRPAWDLATDQNAKTYFRTSALGTRVAIGAKGKVTGSGADCILIDDPNDLKEVHSDVIRQGVIDGYNAYRNRLNQPNASFRVLIQQRLHENDLSGHVLSVGGWEHLRIPQLYEIDGGCACVTCKRGVSFIGWKDPRTKDGELLHPERYPTSVIEEERANGEYYFAGQHQQRPAPSDGGVFKRSWWGWFELKPPDDAVSFRLNMTDEQIRQVRPWDFVRPDCKLLTLSIDSTFGTKTDTSDYNSLLVVGRVGAQRYVLDNITLKMNLNETLEAIRFLRARWGRRLVEVLVELKANGQSIIDSLKNAGVSGVLGFDPKKDNKVARAHAIEPFVRAGDVLLPKDAPWVDSFMHELSVFPNGAHDDQVDALSQCLIHMHAGGSLADFVAAFGK